MRIDEYPAAASIPAGAALLLEADPANPALRAYQQIPAALFASADIGRSLFARGSGTSYVLTNAQAEVVFGTTSPAFVLDRIGTWLLFPTIQLQTQAATFAANRTATCNVRRTNNTPATLGVSAFRIVPVMTTLTTTQLCLFQSFTYTTTVTTDRVALWADISTLPTAGTIEAVRASLLAVFVGP